MRKILTIVSVLSLVSFNSFAFDASSLSVTAGIAHNSAVYGASAKETNRNESNVVKTTVKEHGVFTDNHTSMLVELNAGDFVSVGFEHTPDAISTPENKRITNTNATTTVKADFNNLNIAYLKFNVPGGVYLKAGLVEVDIDVKESMASGSTYANQSTEGTVLGVGYSKALGDSPFSIRVEGSYMELDAVMTSNGVSKTGGSKANGGRNQIDVSNLEGANAKVALTFTLGQ